VFGSVKEAQDEFAAMHKESSITTPETTMGELYNIISSGFEATARREGNDITERQAQIKTSIQFLNDGIVGHRFNSMGGKNVEYPNYVIFKDSVIETNAVTFRNKPKQSIGKAASSESESFGKRVVSLDSKRKDIFNEDSDTAKAWIAIGRNGMSQPIAERFSTRSRDEAEREIYKKYLTKKDILEAARIQGDVKPSFTTEEGSAGNQYIQNLLNERSNGRYLDEIKELKKAKPTEMARAKEDFGKTLEDKRTDAEKARDTMAYNRERVEFLKKTPEELQDLAAQHADSEAYGVQAEAYQEAKTEGVTLSDKELEQIRNNSYEREYKKELTRLQKRQENLKYNLVRGASAESESIKYEDKPGSDLEIWKQKILRLDKETSASEKESDPDTWTPHERYVFESGDWKEFSRLRGYSEQEIKVYQEYLDAVQEGVDKYGWSLDDIQSWTLFGTESGRPTLVTGVSAKDPSIVVASKSIDPNSIANEAEFQGHVESIYLTEGREAALEFFTTWKQHKAKTAIPVPSNTSDLADAFHKINVWESADSAEFRVKHEANTNEGVTSELREQLFRAREGEIPMTPELKALEEKILASGDKEIVALIKKARKLTGDERAFREFETGQARYRVFSPRDRTWKDFWDTKNPLGDKVAEEASVLENVVYFNWTMVKLFSYIVMKKLEQLQYLFGKTTNKGFGLPYRWVTSG
jgi:hypothetical protein